MLRSWLHPVCHLALVSCLLLPACDNNCLDCDGWDPCGPSGLDSDGDGLNDDVERCTLGTDPYSPDTDRDGLTDTQESGFGKICVALSHDAQRRPVVRCQVSWECLADELCQGIDPTMADSDGDGVRDGDEIPNASFEATLELGPNDSDPRLWDSDGDGVSDLDSGIRICRNEFRIETLRRSLQRVQIGLDPAFGFSLRVADSDSPGLAMVFDEPVSGVAGLLVSAAVTQPTLDEDRLAVEQALKNAVVAAGATIGELAVGSTFMTGMRVPAIHSTFMVLRDNTTASALRNDVVNALTGGHSDSSASAGSGGSFYLDVTTLRYPNDGVTTSIISFSPTSLYDDPSQPTSVRVADLMNGSALGDLFQSLIPHCTGPLSNISNGVVPLNDRPISSTLLVTVNNQLVPRSRTDGFEYDPGENSIVFHGSSFTPQPTDTVYVDYQRWVNPE